MPTYRSISGSSAEDLFIELFSDTFGAEKADYLYPQYPFFDIYQNSRFADFMAMQLNDTHPAMSIPELIRLLLAEGMTFEQSFDIAPPATCCQCGQ